VSLAEKSFLRRGLALAQAAVDRLRNVSLRVSQILDADRPRATRVWRPAPVLVGGVSLVCLVALSHTPTRLVSFQNDAASPALTSAIAPGDFEATQISHMGAHVIPAKLQLRPERVRADEKRSVATSGVKDSFRRTSKPGVIPANAVQRRANPPMLVRTSMPNDAVAPQTLFLVMQTELVQTRQYDASGAVVWDLCVWRVTVIGPGQKLTSQQIIAKAI
jgi:hypothetical protein